MTDQTPAENHLTEVWASLWRSNIHESEDDQSEFQARIPRMMAWLRELKERGSLVACGGGAWEEHAGGLTLLRAASYEEAKEMSDGNPMNEIGTSELMVWDVYFAALDVPRTFEPTAASA